MITIFWKKNKVRQLKEDCKNEAIRDQSILCATFDLQQVIYLPISKDSQIFYKRRLSNFNFTFYNIATKECDCFVWNEGQGKRGSSEMSTGVAEVLKFYDDKGVKKLNSSPMAVAVRIKTLYFQP